VLVVLALPAASQALQVGVGASAWYADWSFESDNGNAEFDPAFIYGPILTLGFSPKWALSGVFLYGKFDQTSTGGGPGEISRFDSDVTLNYSVSQYFKVFAGLKYMGYTFDEGDHTGYGPGFGISIVVPVSDSLFLLGSLSGLYIWGSHNATTIPNQVTTPARPWRTGSPEHRRLSPSATVTSTSVPGL
jgi:hypothetical protein